MTFCIHHETSMKIDNVSLDQVKRTLDFKFKLIDVSSEPTKTITTVANRKKLIILAIDKSKSTSVVWSKIQFLYLELLKFISILKQLHQHQNNIQPLDIVLEILLFNDECKRFESTENNQLFTELLKNEISDGKTCLASTFTMINDIIKNHYKINNNLDISSEKVNTDTSIIIISDGNHSTEKNHKESFKELCNTIEILKSNQSSVICNTIGFKSKNKRLEDLIGIKNKLSSNSGGTFTFIEDLVDNYNGINYLTFEKLMPILNNCNIVEPIFKIYYIDMNIESILMTGGGGDTGSQITFTESGSIQLLYSPILLKYQEPNENVEISFPLNISDPWIFNTINIGLSISRDGLIVSQSSITLLPFEK